MRACYPIIITKGEKYHVVSIPDFNTGTQGEDIADAMDMARDAIGLLGIDMEDNNEPLPVPTPIHLVASGTEEAITTLVDVDFSEYRRKHDERVVRKNCTIPSWMNYEAERRGLNFSALLQDALKAALG